MEFQDPKAGETALAKLKGIQFGILSTDDIHALSVFERNQSIDKARDLWDSRLGVYTMLGKDDQCGTCGAKKAADCDGHFGHINLPMPVYHPLHVPYLKKILSQFCLVCLRYKEKKEPKNVVLSDEEVVVEDLRRELFGEVAFTPEKQSDADADVVKKFKNHFLSQCRTETEALDIKACSLRSKWSLGAESQVSLKRSTAFKGSTMGMKVSSVKGRNADARVLASKLYPAKTKYEFEAVSRVMHSKNGTHRHTKVSSNTTSTKTQSRQTKLSSKTISTKAHSRLEAAYIASKGHGLSTAESSSDDNSPLAFQRTSMKFSHSEQEKLNGAITAEDSDASQISESHIGCKYCGADLKDPADRYPDLSVTLTKKKENSYETIEMKAGVKEDLVPLDYWDFVHGHPGGSKNIRPLIPFEALQILTRLSGEVIKKLGMHEKLARPSSLILCTLPVPPSGVRIREHYSSSSLPKARMDKQHRLLQRISLEVKSLQSSRMGKPNFNVVKSEVMELQCLASHYLKDSKWEHGLQPNRQDPEVQKDDKLMKGHILAKRNNVSARLIVVGDPSIKIEEILVPIDLVEQLTIPEKVTALSMDRLQEYVNNGPHADVFKTGAVRYDRSGRQGMGLYRTSKNVCLEIGDTVHRHLKDGDLIIVNRPPSLTKHSLMAMRVRLHLGSTFAINPLICAPFQADFDGDCMHVFVPQSPEVQAEVHELMNVPSQLINPQGGQSNSALTEDSRLGAYLITSSCLFLDKIKMSQYALSNSVSLPIPAILKSPNLKGPLWTGQQLYSITLPRGTYFRATHKRFTSDAKKGILVRDGELLVCDGRSNWLEDAQDALVAVISRTCGPTAALEYLYNAQELANVYLRDHGFSVGLQDYQLAKNCHSRDRMLVRMKEELVRANAEALLKMLILDEKVQRQELQKDPASRRGFSIDTQCSRSKGLYLGRTGSLMNVSALEKAAISGFQSRFSQRLDGLARDYSAPENSLLLMVKAGSKGSMSKLVQQTISLGLQLFKGEHLLQCGAQGLACQQRMRNLPTLSITDLLRVEQGAPLTNLSGYWESRGIISNSYLDGLLPLEFFIHTIASRYGIQRAGVEEPNLLLKRLLLFMRDLHVGYDGSVCNSQGRIVQYEYGGLLERGGEDREYRSKRAPEHWPEAGEAVGILAATSVTEPAYQLKLDSVHMIGAKAIGPLDLFNETLSGSKIVKLVDRRILLRMPRGLRNRHHGQEKGAMKIQQHLKPITLNLVISTYMIQYEKVAENGESGDHKRKSPWIGHIHLSMEKLKLYQVSVSEIVGHLSQKYSKYDDHRLIFSSSNNCYLAACSANREEMQPCVHFFADVPQFVAECNDQQYEDYMSALLEVMKGYIEKTLLGTTVKGDERVDSVHIFWEEATWNPRCTKYSSPRGEYKQGNGELVLEVTIKPAHCKRRGIAWEIVKEACLPIFQLLDWQRSTPYSVQEIKHTLGLEAARETMLQRLELAMAGMGKPVQVEHLKLIVDGITSCGEVNGAYYSGYRDLCKSTCSPTPFTNATFGNHKRVFIEAAREGASEHMGGAVATSVWGKSVPLGTGSSFELLWQEKVGEKPIPKFQKGTDAHQHYAELNSLLPREQAKSFPVLGDKSNVDGLVHMHSTVRDCSQPLLQPIETISSGGDDVTNGQQGDQNLHQTPRAQSGHVERASSTVSEDPHSCPPQDKSAIIMQLSREHRGSTKLRAARLSKRSRLKVDMDQDSNDEGPHFMRRSDQMTEKQEVHASPSSTNYERVSKHNAASQLQAQSPGSVDDILLVTLPPTLSPHMAEDPPGSLSPEASEGSASSFHTPKETLETHSANSTPCSSFQENTFPTPVRDESNSEGDQMSSISQPSSQKELLGMTVKRDARSIDSLECSDVDAFGWVSSSGGRSSGRHKNLQKTLVKTKLTVSDDNLERQKEKLNDEWEDLLRLARVVKFILHRKYKIGGRLEADDQRLIVNRVLRFHPDYVQKVGSGVHYVKVDRHQNHLASRCFYVVRVDKTTTDFSYHKCIKGVANAKSPTLAMQYDHEFLLKHERENLSDLDLLESPDLDPLDFYPSWAPVTRHDQHTCDMNLQELMEKPGGDLNTLVRDGEQLNSLTDDSPGSRRREDISCETSEPEPAI